MANLAIKVLHMNGGSLRNKFRCLWKVYGGESMENYPQNFYTKKNVKTVR